MKIEIHFHHVVTITHNCAAAVVVAAASASARASHSRRPDAGVWMTCLVLLFWLCGCLFVCIWYGQLVSNCED